MQEKDDRLKAFLKRNKDKVSQSTPDTPSKEAYISEKKTLMEKYMTLQGGDATTPPLTQSSPPVHQNANAKESPGYNSRASAKNPRTNSLKKSAAESQASKHKTPEETKRRTPISSRISSANYGTAGGAASSTERLDATPKTERSSRSKLKQTAPASSKLELS